MSGLPRIASKVRNFWSYVRELGIINAIRIAWQKLQRRQFFDLQISGVAHPVYCRPGDLYVLLEVFGRISGRVYNPALLGTPELIIDAGANVGFASAMFANRYPMARIIAIEPDQQNCEIFRMNCNSYPNVRLVQAALWFRSGWVTIQNPGDASFLFHVAESEKAAHAIEAVTIPEILAGQHSKRIDILKLDIEGGETRLFSRDCEWLRWVRVIIAELHDQYVNGCTEALFCAIKGRRFRHTTVKGLDLVEFLDN